MSKKKNILTSSVDIMPYKAKRFIKPSVIKMHNNYVVTNPKDTLVSECVKILQKSGYRIEVIKKVSLRGDF